MKPRTLIQCSLLAGCLLISTRPLLAVDEIADLPKLFAALAAAKQVTITGNLPGVPPANPIPPDDGSPIRQINLTIKRADQIKSLSDFFRTADLQADPATTVALKSGARLSTEIYAHLVIDGKLGFEGLLPCRNSR